MVELWEALKNEFRLPKLSNNGERFRFYEWKLSSLVLLLCSAFFVLIFYKIAFARIDYPFDLEWMEGGAVDHVVRVMDGEPLYVEPSPEFVPYIYTPLSYYVGAGFSYVLGEGYMPLRLISILSITVCFYLMLLMVWKETKDILLSFLAPGLMAATYTLCNNWFDIGRVDSLFLMFLLLTGYQLRYATNKHWWLAPLMLYLAFMTKQSALIAFPFFAVYALWKDGKKGLWFVGLWILMVGLTILIYDSLSDGWFYFYIFEVGSGHEILDNMYWDFWKHDLYDQFKFPLILALGYTVYLLTKILQPNSLFLLAMCGGFVGMSYFGRLHSGGDTNVLMPAYCAISLLAVMAIKDLWNIDLSRFKVKTVLLPTIVAVLAFWQFSGLRYYSATYIPNEADLQAGNQILDIIENADGPVMVSSHGYWQRMAGKETNAHFMAAYDILRMEEDNPPMITIHTSTIDRIKSQYYETIIQDNAYFIGEVEQFYDLAFVIKYETPETFIPKSGAKLRPVKVYVRKKLDN